MKQNANVIYSNIVKLMSLLKSQSNKLLHFKSTYFVEISSAACGPSHCSTTRNLNQIFEFLSKYLV